MAQERLVVRKPLAWYAPAANPTVYVAIEGFVKKITLKPKRDKLEVKGWGDTGNRNEKTDPNHEVEIELYHSRTWSEFSALLATELNADDPTMFRIRLRGAVAVGSGNLAYQFAVQFTSLGNIGGEKNTASMVSETFPIEGQIYSSTDGTTFTVYV